MNPDVIPLIQKEFELLRSFLTSSTLLALLLLCGCSDSTNGDFSERPVVSVEDDDKEMITAIETAKSTFPFFEKNWKTMKSDGYSLKFALPTEDGELEHVWFSPSKIQGNDITGECANNPVNVPGLKLGDTRTVSRNDVSDWMIVVGRKCFGGYTIRVLANRDPAVAPPLEFIDPPLD